VGEHDYALYGNCLNKKRPYRQEKGALPPFLISKLHISGEKMSTKHNKRKLASAGFWLLIIISIFSWIQFAWPTFAAFLSTNKNFTPFEILLILLNPFDKTIYKETIFAGPLFLTASFIAFTSIGLVYNSFANYINNSRSAISVIYTKIDIVFHDLELSKSTITRNQYIHANQPSVRAYRSSITTSAPNGKVIGNSYRSSSSINGKNITEEVMSFGDDNSLELIEIFKSDLPINKIATYLPNFAVYQLRSIFSQTIVERQTQIVQENEYNHDKPSFSLSSIRYPVSNATITVSFPNSTAPSQNDIKALLISENLADIIDITTKIEDPSRTIYCVNLKELRNSTLKIIWNNNSLKNYIENLNSQICNQIQTPSIT
jgi:hypothetical protein